MSEKERIDTGGAAFPQMVEHEQFFEELGSHKKVILPNGGMTLRQWFAGMALMGMTANPDLSKAATEKFGLTPSETRKAYAKSAYLQADDMIAEGKKS